MSIVAAFMLPHPPMIIPEIGKGQERQIDKTINSYNTVAEEIARLKPETIIVSSPHSVIYSDYFHISPGSVASGSFVNFGAPQVRFDLEYDKEIVEALSKRAEELHFPAGVLGSKNRELDHGTMVPLWFILRKYKDFKLVRIGLSGFDFLKHYEFGMMIRDVVEKLGKKTVYIASGDLSHKLQSYGPYGFANEGPIYDSKLMQVCSSARFGELFEFDEDFCQKAAECGHRSFLIMAGALDGRDVKATLYSHEDVTGVGYGICSFYPEKENKERCFLDAKLARVREEIAKKKKKSDDYVKLARASIEHFVKTGKIIELPNGLPDELLNSRAGVFVSIHKFNTLRGCIGTIAPTKKNIALEIIHNAVSAASSDPRFSAVEEDELSYLDISVDVLCTPEKIKSKAELDLKKYGVIVESGHKRGLLLPNLNGIDTIEQQIDIAMRKGGINYGDKIDLYRFEVVRHY